MSDRERLIEAFSTGALVRPSPEHMGFLDVVRGVAAACGVAVPDGPHASWVADRLRDVDHVILLLADGLGIEALEAMPPGSWLRRHAVRSIHAPFPSTTTSAVTSIATGQYPATHAVTGWWVHIPTLQAPATVFAHDRATDGTSLDRLGIGIRELCPSPPIIPTMTRDAALLLPDDIVDSPFTCYMAGEAPRIGYASIEAAAAAVLARVSAAAGSTFTYWYTASPDREAHEHGPAGDRPVASALRLDAAVTSLVTALEATGRRFRIVGTADHGHLPLQPHLELDEDDDLLEELEAPPAGDMRVQFWHVRRGRHDSFAAGFRHRFGRWFCLLTAEEFEALGLLGPEPWSTATRERTGHFVSLSLGNASLRFAGLRGQAGYRRMRSGHSGLSPSEMLVPLIIGPNA